MVELLRNIRERSSSLMLPGATITLEATGSYTDSEGIVRQAIPATTTLIAVNPLYQGRTFFVGNIQHRYKYKLSSGLNIAIERSWRDTKLFGCRVRFAHKYGGGAPMQVLEGVATNDGRVLLDSGLFTDFD